MSIPRPPRFSYSPFTDDYKIGIERFIDGAASLRERFEGAGLDRIQNLLREKEKALLG